MKISESRKRANENYRKNHLDYITIKTRKTDRLRDMVNLAAEKFDTSSNKYMINAIKTQLINDDITIDMLPESEKYGRPKKEKLPKKCMVYMITSFTAEPEDFELFSDGMSLFENYVAIFQTISMAKKYIAEKYAKKPYPEKWYFTIYGREFEAKTKVEAAEIYRKLVRSAIEEAKEGLRNGETTSVFVDVLNEIMKPDYIERIKYDDIKER